ncbi:MAG: site-specific DNA-methyltransferase, partial [Nanoarchaeota archaeon]|nr:site-specific DNA-methyltransferase [Nanoarchaeota archaeon]
KDYSKLEKEDLLKVIEKLESRKKYGLIWDEEKTKEKFEKESENALPVLKEVRGKEIKTDPTKPTNILIEGDNYHALSVLNYTHQGKIDVIYIDPPYNTGAKDWKYNNDYVDGNDTYRHSKWLSFMNKRLILAKRLLKETGILICTIDDNEQARLGLLLEELFPDKKITCITIVHNPAGIQGENFSYTHEYAYFVYSSEGRAIDYQIRNDGDEDIRNFRDVTGEESLRTAAANCFYPILTKDRKIIGFGPVCKDNFHPGSVNIRRRNGVIEIYPVDPQGVERKWRFARQTVEAITKELTIKYIKARNVYDVVRTKNKFNYKTVWTDSRYSANNYGTQLLNKIIEHGSFSYPKSLYAVQDCIRACVHPQNGIVLDFFAGSGTTGHAVALLNKEDGGARQFILCTNNENGIAEEVCYPRIKVVIKGNKNHSDITGIASNLKYFKTSFVKNSIGRDDLKIRITRECTEMLCLREGIFEEVKKKSDYRIFEQNDRVLAIYYALERDSLEQLKKELDKMKGGKILYCFTLDPLGLDKEDFTDWENVSLEPIPQKILDIYEQIYEY